MVDFAIRHLRPKNSCDVGTDKPCTALRYKLKIMRQRFNGWRCLELLMLQGAGRGGGVVRDAEAPHAHHDTDDDDVERLPLCHQAQIDVIILHL